MALTRLRTGSEVPFSLEGADPVLALGEIRHDPATNLIYVGDGTKPISQLAGVGGGDGTGPAVKPDYPFYQDFSSFDSGDPTPSVSTSGLPMHWATGYGAEPAFANGSQYSMNTSYMCTEDMGEPVTSVTARFVVAPISGNDATGSLICVAVTDRRMTPANAPAVKMPAHIWSTQMVGAITYWDAANGQAVLLQIDYDEPLVDDSTTIYDIAFWIKGNRITVIFPNGQRLDRENAFIGANPGHFGFVETMTVDGGNIFCVLDAEIGSPRRAPVPVG